MTPAKIAKGFRVIAQDVVRAIKREADFHTVRPNTATLFLTYRCNSRCKTCTFWQRNQDEEKKKELGLEEWKRIIDKLAAQGINDAEIFGGNVLLRKELLISLFRYMKDKGFSIHLPTNQIGLDEEIAEAISDCVDAVYVSTDGVAEDQEKIRGQKGAFGRVENTVTKLLDFRRKKGNKQRIICNTTVSKFNEPNLEKIVEYAISAGFDEVHFELAGEMTQEDIDNSLIDGLKPAAYYIKQDESILLDHSAASNLHKKLQLIKKKYHSKGIKIITINIDSLSVKSIENSLFYNNKCYVERFEVTVDPSGNVVACPFFNNYIYGNLLTSSFDDLWNKEKHQYFRKCQNSGQIVMCKHCILGVQRNPSFCKSLQRIYFSRFK